MTIGFFIDEFLPKLNGSITSTIAYKQALEKLGHTVYIVAPAEPGYKDLDTSVVRVPSFDPKILKNTARMALLYPGLARKIAKYKFDVVHSQTQFGLGILAHETAKILKVPHISTMHTIYAELMDEYARDVYIGVAVVSVVYPIYFRTMPKFDWRMGEGNDERMRIKDQAWRAGNVFLNSTDGVVAPSGHIAEYLKKYGLTQKCYVLPNGVDVKELQQQGKAALPKDIPPKGKDFWLICVSRLSPEKRQRALIDAMAQVKDKRVKLVLVSPGPSEEELRERIAELGLGDRVYMLGRRENSVVNAIMSRGDLFALASYRFDNQPMVILEALAAGLPLLYCDDHLKEGFTKKNAYLTKSPSPEDFAVAIDQLVKDTKRLKTMSEASLALSAEFDINILAKKLETIYTKTIAAKAKAGSKQRPFLHRILRRK